MRKKVSVIVNEKEEEEEEARFCGVIDRCFAEKRKEK
jgi:hypothetical protein